MVNIYCLIEEEVSYLKDQIQQKGGKETAMGLSFFTCKECGSCELNVVSRYILVVYFTGTLECTCEALEGITRDAAYRSFHVSTIYDRWGPLDEDHHWEYDGEDEIGKLGEEEDARSVFCQVCVEAAKQKDWQIEEYDRKETDEEFYVCCGGCNREIEFGWSHPDRGGRIWPAECSDFNPWESWPEPRYKESWRKKGWLRPA